MAGAVPAVMGRKPSVASYLRNWLPARSVIHGATMPLAMSAAPFAESMRITDVVPASPRPVFEFVLVSMPVTIRVPAPTRVRSPVISSARKAPRRRSTTSEPPATESAPMVSVL